MSGVLRINKKVILNIIILFFFAIPIYVSNFTFISQNLLIGQVICILYILFNWYRQRRTSIISMLAILMYGGIILSTFINGKNVMSAISEAIGNVALILWIDNEKDDIDSLITACSVYFTVVLLINFITIIMYPTGMNQRFAELRDEYAYGGQRVWFMATKNGLGKNILYYLFFKSLLDFRKKDRLSLSFYVMAAICIASLALIWSATSLVSVVLMVIMIIFTKIVQKRQSSWFSIYLFIGLLGLLFFAFVLLQNTVFISDFLTTTLRKDATFNGRVSIWSKAIDAILKSPIIGYGYLSSSDFSALIGFRGSSDAHNILLTFGVYGGLLAVVPFIAIIGQTAKVVRQKQYDTEGILLSAFMFCFLLTMLFEFTASKVYWMIIAYAYIFIPQSKEIQ